MSEASEHLYVVFNGNRRFIYTRKNGSVHTTFLEKTCVFEKNIVSTANLSCLPATTFSSLGLIVVISLQSFESGQVLFLLVFSIFTFSRLILSHSFLSSSVSDTLFGLSFSFLSECFFFVHAKTALAYTVVEFNSPKLDFEHARVWSW